MNVEYHQANEFPFGVHTIGEGIVETDHEDENGAGYSRYRDSCTQSLGLLASTWDSIHRSWQATLARAKYGSPTLSLQLTAFADTLHEMREMVGARMQKEMKRHVLWPWLSQYAGVRGTHTARIVSMIGDPLRFPGKICAKGHHVALDHEGVCPHALMDDSGPKVVWVPCGAEVGAARPGTGTRALWHYLGLHVVDGKMPMRRKGVQCDWVPEGRTALLQPDGVADHIIKHRVQPWRGLYDETKARLVRERGAVSSGEIEDGSGSSSAVVGVANVTTVGRRGRKSKKLNGAERRTEIVRHPGSIVTAEQALVSELPDGRGRRRVNGSTKGAVRQSEIVMANGALRPFQIHSIARVIIAKAFVGDLLAAWKLAVSQSPSN